MRKPNQIKKSIDSVALQASKLGERIHLIACECLAHTKTHGDTSLFAYLVQKLKQTSIHRVNLVAWVKSHAKVETVRTPEGLTFKKKVGADFAKIDLAKATAEPFYMKDTDPNADGKALNELDILKSMLKKRKEYVEKQGAGFNPEKVHLLPDSIIRQIEGIVSAQSATA